MRTSAAIYKMFRLVHPNGRYFPLVITLGLLSAVFEGLGLYLLIPLLENFVDAPQSGWADNAILNYMDALLAFIPEDSRVTILIICIAASIVLKNLVQYLDSVLWAWLEARMNRGVQMKLYDQLMAVDYDYLDRKSSAALVNTFEAQSWSAVNVLALLVYSTIDIAAAAFLFYLLFMLSWDMTLIVICGVIVIASIVHLITRVVERLGHEHVAAEERLMTRLWDSLLGFRTIRVFGKERFETARYEKAVSDVLNIGIRQEVVSAIAGPLVEVLALFLIGGVAIYVLIGNPALLPVVVSFIIILQRLMPRARTLISMRVQILADIASVHNVLAWLDRSDKTYLTGGTQPLAALNEDITFEHVRFSYERGENHVLKDASFVIPYGKTTGIVGPSGAGKSTLTALLCREYDVSAGRILVGDVPLSEIRLQDWRARIAVVNQHIHLFTGTIRENIAYGAPDASMEDVVRAAVRANADEFIRARPEGYETLLSDNASQLSGGQRQRIALARAFIREPDLLILDEATSALDPLSETLVQQAIEGLGEGRTVVVIAHRASTIRRADNIVVLNEGRVVQSGTVDALTGRDGLFREMFGAGTP